MDDVGEGVIFEGVEEEMDVIGHDNEGVEVVADAIEMVEGVGDDLVVVGEEARAVGLVEVGFQGHGEAAMVGCGGFVIPRFGVEF